MAETPRAKAAFVILTQNTPERRVYLQSTLYFLFKHFNEARRYPVRILHEGDFDEEAQKRVRMGLRGDCGQLVTFVTLDAADFQMPAWIDADRLKRNLEARPVPYWRNLRYRAMCRFWLVHIRKYVGDLDIYCRLDDDAWIEQPITGDLFKVAGDSVMTSAIVHVECPVCSYGMRHLFKSMGLVREGDDARLFLRGNVPLQFMAGIDEPPEYDGDGRPIALMPIMFYNNFSLMNVAFWDSPAVRAVIDTIDRTGNQFYYRWGDAPLLTLIAQTLAPARVAMASVRYSKRMQREAFIDHEGNAHSYMPPDYASDSSIAVMSPPPKN